MAQTQSQSSLPFDATPAPEAGAGAGVGVAAGAGAAGAHTLLNRALPAEPGVWDELRQADGQLRPAWQTFAQALPVAAAKAASDGLGDELDRRVGQVAQRIRQDGVTHNVFSDDPAVASAARPWSLELLPQLIEAKDWAVIEAGVAQRAELQQRVLADLYATGPGSQRLLHEGLLPPALLLRHPGWLRPMVGVKPPCGPGGTDGDEGDESLRLFIVAFDLARGPDGRWWQVAQRTQGPSGLGYVMHNRIVVARQFPDAFRELRVQRIASSYRRLLDTLERTARAVALRLGDGAPRVVLLTPGPYSETYFEHAYLARYLGVPLVEGGDLTVRGDRLFLKTVAGLEPVHGLLRRLDDDWCDPLELRSDSTLGVPGLLLAARAGTVVMANALGSAFLESPAIQGFMPGIAERLMDQTLLLPSLPTWWCGEAAAWADVREQLDDKLVRSTYPRGGRTSQLRDSQRDLPREPDAAAVDEDPAAWTVQGHLRFSRAPIWGAGAVVPRPAMVRVYAIAEGGGRWHVLPGGMTRVARREDGSVSMQRGGTSLDTWVLTEGAVDTFSMLPRRLQVDDILQRHRPVSSRTGENLFWLGRYTERTEQLVRLARATLVTLAAPGTADDDGAATQPLLRALSTLGVKTGLAPHGVPTLLQGAHLFERALLAGLADREGREGTASIAYNLVALERAATALRERLSPEHWGLICALREGFLRDLEVPEGELPERGQVLAALDRLGLQLAGVTGAQTDRMTRDHGWRLLTVGRLLERLMGVALRLRVFLEDQALGSVEGIELLLELFDSLITFRARYQRHEDLLAVADLLVLDSDNPRAFAGVLRRLRTEIVKLPGEPEVQRALLDLLPAEGAGLTLESLRGADDAGIARALRALSGGLGQTAAIVAERVSERFFTLAQGVDQPV